MVWHHASVSNATEFGPESSPFPNHYIHIAPQSPSPTSELVTVTYEGYKFFKADPIPGQEPSWTKVERTKMHMTQMEFCKKVQKRANKISAAQQYQFLPEIRQVHVNQLIAENRLLDLQVEWSCVYAKERKRACKARNAHPEDYEVVSMSIILMKRPVATKTHFRTPMGDLVDLGVHFGPRPEKAKLPSGSEAHPGSDHELTNRSGFKDRFMTPFSGPRRSQTFSGEEEVGQDRVVHEPSSRPATAPSSRRRLDLDHGHNWADNDDEDESYAEAHNEQTAQYEDAEADISENECEEETNSLYRSLSNETSTYGSPGSAINCTCQEPLLPQKAPLHDRRQSPRQSQFTFKSNHDLLQLSTSDRLRSGQINEPCNRSIQTIPAKRPRTDALDANILEKKIRIEQMSEEEVRTRLLECEARIEQWGKTIQSQTRILGLQMRIQGLPETRCYQ